MFLYPMEVLAVSCTVTVLFFGSRGNALVLAPYDADSECGNAMTIQAETLSNRSNVIVLMDSHSYLSLDRLWFADDESIDLFTFPSPEDPEMWELVDNTECGNVWQYCGNSTSDILLTQFITRGEVTGTELFVGIDFNFFSETLPGVPNLSCSDENSAGSENVLIVEADDTLTVYSESIPCGVGRLINDSGALHRYSEFTFTPVDDFELVIRANLSENHCVNISRVRVFHHVCPNTTVNYVSYPQTVSGMYAGDCVPNALPVAGPNVTARCTLRGDWIFPPNLTTSGHCLCVPGYSPDNLGNECIACPNGTYKADVGSESCVPCPGNSYAIGLGSVFCQCNTAYARTNPSDVTSACEACARNFFPQDGVCNPCPVPGSISSIGSLLDRCKCLNGSASLNSSADESNSTLSSTCEYCAQNYYRSSSNDSCLICPLNSFRELDFRSETLCNCTPGSLTADGLVQTTTDPCDNCDVSHFVYESQCLPCPVHSSSTGLSETECLCEENTITPNGYTNTTNDDCICLSGLFRSPDRNCIPCPLNSSRNSWIHHDDTFCPCDVGYARRPESLTTEPCYGPVIGFSQQSIQVPEGSSRHMVAVRIYSSFPIPDTISIVLNSVRGSAVQDVLTFPSGEIYIDYFLVIQGDQVALEADQLIQIKLIQSGSGYIIGYGNLIGNQSYHSALNVTVREDDVVHVGFTLDSITSSVSEGYLELIVGISIDVGRGLAIQVTQNVSLSVFSIQKTVLTFVANGSLYLAVPIQLYESMFLVDAFYVRLGVELVEEEYLRDEIRIGGRTGFNEQLTMVLLPPRSEGLTQSAQLGIISFCIAALILVLAVAGILIYCLSKYKLQEKGYCMKTSTCDDDDRNHHDYPNTMVLKPRSSKQHEN